MNIQGKYLVDFIKYHIFQIQNIELDLNDNLEVKERFFLGFFNSFLQEKSKSVEHFKQCHIMIQNFYTLQYEKYDNSSNLNQQILSELLSKNENELWPFAVYLKKQNSVLTFEQYPENENSINIQNFKVLPKQKLFEYGKKIQTVYPKQSILVDKKTVKSKSFEQIVKNLHQFDIQKKEQTVIKTEYRPTKGIKNWFLNSLNGKILQNVVCVKKNINDQIINNANDGNCYRSGMYQCVRFILHQGLVKENYQEKNDLENKGHLYYKIFMLEFKIFCFQCISQFLNYDQSMQILKKIVRRIEKFERIQGNNMVNSKIVKDLCQNLEKISENIQNDWEAKCIIMKNDLSSNGNEQVQDIGGEGDLLYNLRDSLKSINNAMSEFQNQTQDFQIKGLEQDMDIVKDLQYYSDFKFSSKKEILFEELYEFEQFFYQYWKDFEQEENNNNNINIEQISYLESCLEKYYKNSVKAYRENPLGYSKSILVYLSIFLSMDKIVLKKYEELRKYSPGVDADILKFLCLRKKEDMELLNSIEKYLYLREKEYTQNGTILENHQNLSQYFLLNDQGMRDIKVKIKEDEEKAIRDKKAEYEVINQQYNDLKVEMLQLQCEYIMKKKMVKGTQVDKREHSKNCKKCTLKQKIKEIKIEIYEKALPENENDINQVVFELQMPLELVQYKNAIYEIKRNLGQISRDKQTRNTNQSNFILNWIDYEKLEEFSNSNQKKCQVKLCSTQFLYSVKYDKLQKIEKFQNSDSIIKENLYNLKVCEIKNKKLYMDSNYRLNIAQQCSFDTLPPYTNLQYSQDKPQKSENTIICKKETIQDKIKNISIHELLEFASLRTGNRLIYRNLILCLQKDILSFEEPAVCCLIQQALFQVWERKEGEEDNFDEEKCVGRDSHQDLLDEEFVYGFNEFLREYLKSVSQNWQKYNNVFILLVIFLRINCFRYDLGQIVEIVKEFRVVFGKWIQEIQRNLKNSYSKQEIKQMKIMLLDIAEMVQLTYDFEQKEIFQEILKSEYDILNWLEAAHTFFENSVLMNNKNLRKKNYISLIYEQQKVQIFNKVREIIKNDPIILVEAAQLFIVKHWILTSEIVSFEDWEMNSSWIQVVCKLGNNQEKLVKINFLYGDFLVNDTAVMVIPKKITQTDLYQTVFGDNLFDVQQDGKSFKTKKDKNGSQFQFFFIQKNLIRIREYQENGDVLELLDQNYFKNDLPYHYKHNFSHWLSLGMDKKIIFRPCSYEDEKFHFLSQNPEIFIDLKEIVENGENKKQFCMKQVSEDQILWFFDPFSQTYEYICQKLERIEQKKFIHIFQYQCGQIMISLPRMGLQFEYSKEENQIYSCDFQGHYVSEQQYVGALLGLDKGLYLKDKLTGAINQIIIPHCTFQVGDYNDTYKHHSVIGKNDKLLSPPFFSFEIDYKLDIFKGQNQLSQLYLAYLLAISSSALPNPFNKLTGTENAIVILKSGFCFTNRELCQASMGILQNIKKLVPQISHYRDDYGGRTQINFQKNKKESFGFLCQNMSLYFICQDILQEARKFQHFLAKNDTINKDQQLRIIYYLQNRKFYNQNCLLDQEQEKELGISSFLNDMNVLWSLNFKKENNLYDDEKNKHKLSIAELVQRVSCCVEEKKYNYVQYEDEYKLQNFIEKAFRIDNVQGGEFENKILEPNLNNWIKLQVPQYILQFLMEICLQEEQMLNENLRYFLSFLMFFGSEKNENFIFFLNNLAIYCKENRNQILAELELFKQLNYDLQNQHNYQNFYKIVKSIVDTHKKFRNFDLKKHYSDEKKQKFQECEVMGEKIVLKISNQFKQDSVQNNFKEGHTTHKLDAIVNDVNSYITRNKENQKLQSFLSKLIENVKKEQKKQGKLGFEYQNFNVFTKKILSNPMVDISVSLKENYNIGEIQQDIIIQEQYFDQEDNTNEEISLINEMEDDQYEEIGDIDKIVQKIEVQMQDLFVFKEQLEIQTEDNNQYLSGLFFENQSGIGNYLEGEFRNSQNCFYENSENNQQFQQKQLRSQDLFSFCVQGQQTLERKKQILLNTLRNILESQQKQHQKMAQISDLGKKFNTYYILRLLLSLNNNSKEYEIIVKYCKIIVLEQKMDRIKKFTKKQDFFKAKQEIYSIAHKNWNPYEKPEWLIFQIENNLIIREIQVDIANHLLDAQDGQNKITQLNMGEGKTKVITPIIASCMADGSQIARITVLNSLFNTNFEDLQMKLGGILNQRIYCFPCSRDMKFTDEYLQFLYLEYVRIKKTKGVILTVPEHRLSFGLKMLDLINNKQYYLAVKVKKIMDYLDEQVRDQIDECDEILDMKYQLLYTIGIQTNLCEQKLRCEMIQAILEISNEYFLKKQKSSPFIKKINGFFVINDINTQQYKELCQYVTEEMFMSSNKYKIQFGLNQIDDSHLQNIKNFIIENYQEEEENGDFESYIAKFELKEYLNIFLIMKGVLSYNILFEMLQKRWRINYGVSAQKSKLMVVPYRGKDIPAAKAEFGHPDMAIGLTCMHYYYFGLSNDQLEQVFEHLQEAENGVLIYTEWVQKIKLISPKIKKFSDLNLKDQQLKEQYLFKTFRNNVDCINYFMNCFVFPQEAKFFPYKLSNNSWDLAKQKGKITTGFSGTNDSQILLPQSIVQQDLDKLKGTNFKVIKYLLQEENRGYCRLDIRNGMKQAVQILDQITNNSSIGKRGQVLIDAGGLMIDLDNYNVIMKWLSKTRKSEIEAGIYFDEDNNIMVLDRNRNVTSFSLSPYQYKLQKCVVYIDEYHTRGTDFHFPPGTHGYVTLGLKLNKDKLVQACMRIRQLGLNHSVSFWGPSEVHNQIYAIKKGDFIDSFDVVKWSIQNSIQYIENGMLLWAKQGINYFQRQEAMDLYKDMKKKQQFVELIERVKEKEIYQLQDMYGGKRNLEQVSDIVQNRILSCRVERRLVQCIQDRIDKYMRNVMKQNTQLEEEQERELEIEIEQEQMKEIPPPCDPRVPKKPEKLRDMVNQQKYEEGYCKNLEKCFENTELEVLQENHIWDLKDQYFHINLLGATREFIQVTDNEKENHLEKYLRSPKYVLVFWKRNLNYIYNNIEKVLFISPFEANFIINDIKNNNNKFVSLHIYAPKLHEISIQEVNLFFNKSMIIPHIQIEVNERIQQIFARILVFSGYLKNLSLREMLWVQQYLGVFCKENAGEEDQLVFDECGIQNYGFVCTDVREVVDEFLGSQLNSQCGFENNPLRLLQKLKDIRHFNYKFLDYQDLFLKK